MLKPILNKLIHQEHLSEIEIYNFIDSILNTDNTIQIATSFALMHAKGETIEELFTLLQIFKRAMISVEVNVPVLDIVGTGGDGSHTFNISTAASFLSAACGINVIKHGNRAVSSKCGAADILESFEINLDVTNKKLKQTLEKYNFAFCFAPFFHPLLKKFSTIRKQLEIPTFFNLLGPLLNPASPQYLILGVKNEAMIETYISLIKKMATERALISHNFGTDEINCLGVNKIFEVKNNEVSCFEIDPIKYGLNICNFESLQAFSIEQSKEKFIEALTNVNSAEAHTVILNAAVALYVAKNIPIEEGVLLAKQKIESGEVIELFRGYVNYCISSVISTRSEIHLQQHSVVNLEMDSRLRRNDNDFLKKILEYKQQEILELKQKYHSNKSFKSALKKEHLTVIAEIKRNSPAKGFLSAIQDPIEQAQKYVLGGADAISVLTDKQFFKGDKSEFLSLTQNFKNQNICFLQKDFILDRVQIMEAATLGANAILLIARILKQKLADLIQFAKSLRLDALVEIHSYDELQLALDSGAEIIGVNNRDLTTFQTDINHSLELVDKIPNSIIKVSESAIDSMEKAKLLRQAGFDAVLIGEALVKSENPQNFIHQCRLS